MEEKNIKPTTNIASCGVSLCLSMSAQTVSRMSAQTQGQPPSAILARHTPPLCTTSVRLSSCPEVVNFRPELLSGRTHEVVNFKVFWGMFFSPWSHAGGGADWEMMSLTFWERENLEKGNKNSLMPVFLNGHPAQVIIKVPIFPNKETASVLQPYCSTRLHDTNEAFLH